jgi:hypothetical protein
VAEIMQVIDFGSIQYVFDISPYKQVKRGVKLGGYGGHGMGSLD